MSNYVDVDMDMVLISIYNSCEENEDNKIAYNDEKFFDDEFDNSYDAAWAVTLSKRWKWTDDFVYFDKDGYITSFNHWDDVNSPINLDKLDICQLISSLKKMSQKRYVVDNIPRAIHDALQE